MKKIKDCGIVPQASRESGQASIYLILVLGMFLFTAMALSVDLTNMWFHRQQAQTAADAGCQAGVLDMLALANGHTPPGMHFTANTGDPGSDCGASPTATICQYAKFNGYDGSGGFHADAASSSVLWTFPSSTAVPGATPPPALTVAPYLKVVVAENVKTWFLNLIQVPYVKTSASCMCGLSGSAPQQPTPLVVLDPTSPRALYIHDAARLTIEGGPQLALEVNSTNKDAVVLDSGVIDTSKGGPNAMGSDVGTAGPTVDPGTSVFCRSSGCGTTGGSWLKNSHVAADPFEKTLVPAKLAVAAVSSTDVTRDGPHVIANPQDSCPDKNPTNWINNPPPLSLNRGCLEFEPGRYTTGINIANDQVAVFKPGVYYLEGDLHIQTEARLAKPCVPSCSPYSTAANQWQLTDGLLFYFNKGTMVVDNGAGGLPSWRVTSYPSTDLTCDGSSPSSIPSGSLDGNVLVAQCTKNGTYYDPQGDTTDTKGNPGGRGLLFFQAPGNSSKPTFSGGGMLAFSGSMYFHSTGYKTVFMLSNAGANKTFVLGQIIADRVEMTGSSALRMTLNSAASSGGALKVGFF